MASLENASIASSYTSLLKLNGNTDNLVAGASGDAIQIVDGNGTGSSLYLNTDRIGIGIASPVTSLDLHALGTEIPAVFGMADDGNAFIATRVGEVQNRVSGYAFMVGSSAIDGYGSSNTSAVVTSTVLNDGGTLQGDLKFYTNSGDSLSNNLTISASGSATFAGEVIVSSGVNFPDDASANPSSDANTLDDYEEGDWTATDGSGNSLSFTLQYNKYVKIGKLVSATMVVTFPVTSNTDLARLTLPINATTINSSSGGVVLEQNINTSNVYNACVNYTDGVIFRLNGGTGQTNADLSGKKLRFTITYHA